jgi:alcohol dehydrogenase class IV
MDAESEGAKAMQPFVYEALPSRVVFGFGTVARLRSEAERLGVRRVLVLSTPSRAEAQARAIAGLLGELSVGIHAGVVMHTPVEATEKALEVVRDLQADAVAAVGGGSTTGLGKAIALRTDLPQIVLPTTYAGSEMTPILGETKDGVKTTQRTPKVLPEVVIYDVDLTLGLPPAIAATSGMNAMAHAVEALYARDRNPIISLMAEEGIRSLARALPKIGEDLQDREARAEALYGAWLCGTCLGSVGMALHHKLCHVLGGTFDLPHAETHTIVLPHAVSYNASAAPEAMERITRALSAGDATQGLFDLAERLGTKRALRDIGMPADGIEQAIKTAMAAPYWNPRPLDEEALRDLLTRAWNGDPPPA